MKNIFKLLFVLLLAVFTGITSCQRDDSHLSKNFSTGSSRLITLQELKGMPQAYARLSAVIQAQQHKTAGDSIFRFEVLTDDILLYEKDGYKSLTFVVQPEIERTYVENLVLNQETDGSYSVYYTVYNFTEEEKEKIARDEAVGYSGKMYMCPLPGYDTSDLLKARKLGGVYKIGDECFQDYVETLRVWSNIPGQVEYSENVIFTEKVECPQLDEDPSYSHNGGGGGPPDLYFPSFGPDGQVPSNPGLSAGSRRNVITRPITVLKDIGCDKIKAVMELGGYRAKVTGMVDKVNDVSKEHGFGMYTTGTTVDFTPAQQLEIPLPFWTNKYTGIHHTHNDAPNGGTYSIFSYEDIEGVMKLLKTEDIDADKFVATLSTKKGTHYAFTINNVNKFKEYFYHKFNAYGSLSDSDKFTYNNARKKEEKIIKKYFDVKSGVINESETINERALGYFLNFMKEADMGITLFEADAAFESFTKVEKKKNNTYLTDREVKRTPCNKSIK